MPPKEDKTAAAVGEGLPGFNAKETKMIAAAFLSATDADKVCTSRHLQSDAC